MGKTSLRTTLILAILLVIMVLPAISAEKPKTDKLNFVFVLIDDMGWTDLGCFGSKFYETPNIDRLCSEGMKFTNAYAACSVCSPTRASIMTGKYPARIDLTNYIGGGAKGKLLPAEYVHHMASEEITIAEAFKENGYVTFFAGKWHLGKEEQYLPEAQGFDINKGGWRAGAPSYRYVNKEGKTVGTNKTFRGGFFVPYNNPKLKDGPEGEYLTDRLTDESVKFLEQHKDKPFLLYLSHYAVHNPQQAKKEYIEKYEKKLAAIPIPAGLPRKEFEQEHRNKNRLIQNQPIYAAMVQSVDDSVGRVLDKIKELGLDKNTAIFFMSDNGGLSTSEGTPTSNLPLRAGKGWNYEGGIREPVIVKWPGVTKSGSVCDVPVISNDFYPTMLDMAGLPLKPKQHVDGISFASLLKGKKSLDRDALYWHYPHYSNQGDTPSAAIRVGDYKYIEHFEDGEQELYNLKDDLGERNDLSKKMPDKTKELKSKLHKWMKSVDAKMPTPNPNYKPRKRRN